MTEGIRLSELERGDCFRTASDRVGELTEKDRHWLRVTWRDGGGPAKVHPNLVVMPWPREDPPDITADAPPLDYLGGSGPGGW